MTYLLQRVALQEVSYQNFNFHEVVFNMDISKWWLLFGGGGFSKTLKNGAFGKPSLRPLPKTGGFNENGENDEFSF